MKSQYIEKKILCDKSNLAMLLKNSRSYLVGLLDQLYRRVRRQLWALVAELKKGREAWVGAPQHTMAVTKLFII